MRRLVATVFCLLVLSTAGRAETILEALTTAYSHSPRLRSFQLQSKSIAEDVELLTSEKMPTINFAGDLRESFSTAPDDEDRRSLSVGLNYRHQLFDGQIDARIEQARALSDSQLLVLRNEEQNLLLSVAEAYANVVRDTHMVRLRSEAIAFFQQQVTLANQMYAIGEGTRAEISLAESRLATAAGRYQSAIASLKVSQSGFERWVGHQPRHLAEVYPAPSMLPRSLDDALASADNRHPAILSAKASLRAAQAASEVAVSAFGPSVELLGDVGMATGLGDGDWDTSLEGSVRLTLTVPIYSGGRLNSSVRKANFDHLQAEMDAIDIRQQVRQAVTAAWSTLEDASAQILSAHAEVSSGEITLQSVLDERAAGERPLADVLSAQSDLAAARENLVQAQSYRLTASFALLAAAGRLTLRVLQSSTAKFLTYENPHSVRNEWQDLRETSSKESSSNAEIIATRGPELMHETQLRGGYREFDEVDLRPSY